MRAVGQYTITDLGDIKVYQSPTQPTSADLSDGDIWIDTTKAANSTAGRDIYYYSNGGWVKHLVGTDSIAVNAITAALINVTDLFAQDITATGTIRGAKLVGGSIDGATLFSAHDDAYNPGALYIEGARVTTAFYDDMEECYYITEFGAMSAEPGIYLYRVSVNVPYNILTQWNQWYAYACNHMVLVASLLPKERDNVYYFISGETYSQRTATIFHGFISTSTTQIVFCVPLPKSLENITNSQITVASLKGYVRGINGYVDGTNSNNDLLSQYTVSTAIVDNRTIRVTATKSSALTNATNNTPIIVNGSIELTFS